MTRLRGLAVAVLVLATAGCSDDREPDGEWRVTPLGPGSWRGVRTTPEGGLRVVLIGAAEYREGNPCTVDYRGEAIEDASVVRVRVLSRTPAGGGEAICTLEGYTRWFDVALDRPLGGRRVIEDQFDREHPVFDGERLVEPPVGWTLSYESAQESSWLRTFKAGDCWVLLTQGPASIVDGPRPEGADRVVRTRMSGSDGLVATAPAECEADLDAFMAAL